MDFFSCSARRIGGHVVLTVGGDLDLATYHQLQGELDRWVGTAGDVVLDCAGVGFLDSTGVQVLVRARRRAAAANTGFALAAPSPAVTRVLDLAGVRDLFPIVELDLDPTA